VQEVVTRFLLAALAAAAALPATAVTLGEARVVSALGEPLDIRIPVGTAQGEAIEGGCFTLARESAPDAPRLATARLGLERSSRGAILRVRSTAPIEEAAFAFAIRVACPGQVGESRKYSVVLDPRAAGAPSPSAVAAAVATLIARIGDTLESIAHAIFPGNRSAKKAYIAALRDANPPLAALGDNDPIPIDTPIALPDLRTFARGHPIGGTQVASAPRQRAPSAAPVAREEPRRVARAPERSRPSGATRAETPRREAEVPPPPRVKAAPRGEPQFVLRLSGAQVDLAPSRGIDDRKRAQLRERLLLLDADDQVAALLALQNSVKQLESRVAELQLKLAGMPSSFPPPKDNAAATAAAKAEAAKAEAARAQAAKAEAARAEAARAEAARADAAKAEAARAEAERAETAKAEAARAEAAKAEAARAEAARAEAAKAEAERAQAAKAEAARAEAASAEAARAAAAKAEAAKAQAEKQDTAKAQPGPAEAPKTQPKPGVPIPAEAPTGWLTDSLWLFAGFVVVLALLLVWRLARRRRGEAEPELEDELPAEADERVPEVHEEAPIVVAEERQQPAFAAEPARPSMASDAVLPTRISFGDSDGLRRRYIEERFPEVATGAIKLEQPDSVIKAARLFYEDGAIARAVELLHFAIDVKPEEVRLWLALFEIFRLERLSGEYAELARRFKERHGESDAWRKVQYFGREIDPGNTLYAEESFKSLETIGPAAARRIAASDFDPLAENWLNAPMDFQNEVLANDLRTALMADAKMREQDLLPNPMPALRNVEIFSVA